MAVYKCSICGYLYDEENEGKPFSELTECPVCKQPVSKFTVVSGGAPKKPAAAPKKSFEGDLAYDPAYAREDPSCRYMAEIHEMAVTGHSIHAAMGTQMAMPGWDDIYFLGAQLNPAPLNDGDEVNTVTIIGRHAKKPMVLQSPIYISHMSFGALSKEIKEALAAGAAMARTAMCSGEGGILPEERAATYKYIFVIPI